MSISYFHFGNGRWEKYPSVRVGGNGSAQTLPMTEAQKRAARKKREFSFGFISKGEA